ncbi:MAG: hypothetical protein M0R03_18205, partial [Novosphingobium sp.]|nr:hypothetical protein [Novosphingobium sp.]
RIAKAYNQGDAIPSHNITNPLKETDTIFKLEEHSAYQDYKIKQAAIRRAPRNCAYYDISGYELNKKIENFKQAIKNNLFSGQYLPYDSIEIVTRKIDKVSDKETESEFSFAKVFNKAKYNLTKPEDPDRSIKLGGTCTIDYKREKINLEDCDYSEVYCLLKNKEFRYLILHDKQFEARYIEWQNYLIDLAASTNCTPRDNMFGHPEIAKIIMVNTQNDHYPPGFAFNHLRENLLKIYFDKKTGGLKELRTANEEQKVTKAIVDFVYDISPNKQAYINNLNRLRDKRVYHLDPVLRENQILDPKNFDQYSKRPPRINLYKDKEFLDNIITNDTVQVYAQVSNILFNHDFALARRTIESLKCSNKVKEDLNYAYRTMYFKEHDAHGIRNAFKDDPIVGTLSQEDYKELNNNLQDLDKFNALLMVRHIYAQQWAPQFNIKNLDNKILKHHLYEFAYLAEDPELAIDSLLKLSSDCESQESKKAYSSLFNDKGILRILERNKLISKYDFSDILSTSQATELRRYLNYALTFNVGKESENHIKQILDYIDEASKLLSTDKEKAESYIEIVKNLYNAISLENSDKTILKCDSFLSVYDDIQKQNLQNTFTNAVSKCVRFMDNINSVQEYMNNIKIVEKIILHANQGQIQLRQNNVGLAEIISNRLSEIFYNDSKEINIEKAKELALFLENIN